MGKALEPMGAKIVIIEDELIIAEDLRLTLLRLGYLVVGTFVSGEAALEVVTGRPPDLAVVDLAMVDIRLHGAKNGIETARDLRRLGVRVVFFTAHTDEATLAPAREVADGFVFKPFEDHVLAHVLEDVIRRK